MILMFVLQGGHLLLMTNKVSTLKDGEHLIWSKIEDGSALLKFQELLIQQGVAEHMAKELCRADSDVWTVLPKAAFQTPFKYEGQSGKYNRFTKYQKVVVTNGNVLLTQKGIFKRLMHEIWQMCVSILAQEELTRKTR